MPPWSRLLFSHQMHWEARQNVRSTEEMLKCLRDLPILQLPAHHKLPLYWLQHTTWSLHLNRLFMVKITSLDIDSLIMYYSRAEKCPKRYTEISEVILFACIKKYTRACEGHCCTISCPPTCTETFSEEEVRRTQLLGSPHHPPSVFRWNPGWATHYMTHHILKLILSQ